jgi:predicted Zn-dependent protease
MKVASREIVVKMLQAALESGEYRFARQTAISWLAAFPGDLEVIVLQSKAVIAEGKPARVIPALDLVCRKDPLYLPAYRALAWASREVDPAHYQYAITAAFVLGEQIPPSVPLEGWGKPLKEAWTSIENQQYQEALTHIDEALEEDSSLLLAQVFQLLAFRALKEPQEFAPIAQDFYSRNPDCLLNCLVLAEAYLQQGNEFEAVRLLHLGASGDSLGQVARRLWGEDHPLPLPVAGRYGHPF